MLKHFLKKAFLFCLSLFYIEKKRLAFPVFRKNFYSQDGEDGIIEFILKKIPDVPPFIVDIGANDGITNSNSRMLIEKYNFSALLIEPFSEAFKKLQHLYYNNPNVVLCNDAVGPEDDKNGAITWHGHFSEVTTPIKYINDVFDQYDIPNKIGFLSIDTDGHDNDILQVINWEKYRPDFVIAEIDSFSNKNLQIQVDIMDLIGYFPLFHIGNVIYCRKDIAGIFLFNWRLYLPYEFGFFIKNK